MENLVFCSTCMRQSSDLFLWYNLTYLLNPAWKFNENTIFFICGCKVKYYFMCYILQFCEIQIYTIHSVWQTPASVNRRHSQERQTAGLLLIKSKHFSFRVKTWQRIIRHYSITFFIFKNAFIEMYRETGLLLNFAVACFACSVHTPKLSCHDIALEVEQITLLKQINWTLWKHMKSQWGGVWGQAGYLYW